MQFFISAEKFLESVEVNQNYAILLLHLIDKDTVDITIRVAAAIAFKNYIKRNWPVVCFIITKIIVGNGKFDGDSKYCIG